MSDNGFTPGTHPDLTSAPQPTPYAPQPNAYAPPPSTYASPPQYPYAPAQPYTHPRPTSGLAVTALITGIAGIVMSWTFVMLLASIAAVITGHMALNQLRRTPAVAGRGMAIAGVILGYVGVAIIAFSILIGLVSFFFVGSIGLLPFFLS